MWTVQKLIDGVIKNSLNWVQDAIETHKVPVDATKENDSTTALHHACKRGYFQIVEYLIETGRANVEALDSRGMTPLLVACEHGYLDVITYLIGTGGANIQAVAPDGSTVLHLICNRRADYLPILSYLVEDGHINHIDVEARDFHGRTALFVACDKKDDDDHVNEVSYLIDMCGADAYTCNKHGETLLHSACDSGTVALIRYLIESVGLTVSIETKNKKSRTPFFSAIESGDLERVQYMVESAGADINNTPFYGYTALRAACSQGYINVVRYLAEAGHANVDCESLYRSCEYGHFVHFLVEFVGQRAYTHGRNAENGWTALHYACNAGHLEIARYLVATAERMAAAADDVAPSELESAANNDDPATTTTASLVQSVAKDGDLAVHKAFNYYIRHFNASEGQVNGNGGRPRRHPGEALTLVHFMMNHFPAEL